MEIPAQPPLVSSGPAGPSRRWRWWVAIGLLPVLAMLYAFDPAQHAFYPRCGFRLLTGWDCPGCGGLRATHALLHGDLAAAWRLNALYVLALPVAVLALLGVAPGWLRELWRRWWLAALLVASLGFTLWRNW